MNLADVLHLLEQLPDAATVPVGWVRQQLQDMGVESPPPDPSAAPATWREKLWTVPDDTRLGLKELAEALDRPESWVYRHTSEKSGYERLPHRKLDGALTFIAYEIRAWIALHEEIIAQPPTPVVPITRRRRRLENS